MTFRVKLLTALLLLFVIARAEAQNNGSVVVVQPDFRVTFPENPDVLFDTVPFANKVVLSRAWVLNVEDPAHANSYYAIGADMYPTDFITSDSAYNLVEELMNSTQYDFNADADFNLISSKDIEFSGYPGKHYTWTNKQGDVFIEFRVYLINSTLFSLSVVTRPGNDHNLEINKFFNSFTLVDIPDGTYSIANLSVDPTFTIKFPATPVQRNVSLDSGYGKLALVTLSYEPGEKDENYVYVAVETTYPPKSVDVNNPEALNEFYNMAIDNSIRSVYGKLISVKDIKYRKHPGKEFRASYADGKALLVYRVFYINDHGYITGVITSPVKDNNKLMLDFLNSFKLIR